MYVLYTPIAIAEEFKSNEKSAINFLDHVWLEVTTFD